MFRFGYIFIGSSRSKVISSWSIGCLLALGLGLGCGPATPPPAAAPAPKGPSKSEALAPAQGNSPTLSIVSTREHEVAPGSRLWVWELRGNGIKKLTVKLVKALNGKAETLSSTEYEWSDWDPSKNHTGQIVYQLMEGKPFGSPGKTLPFLGVTWKDGPDHTMQRMSQNTLIEGTWHPRVSSTPTSGSSLPNQGLLHGQILVSKPDQAGSFVLGSDTQPLIKASENGAMALGVQIEWQAR